MRMVVFAVTFAVTLATVLLIGCSAGYALANDKVEFIPPLNLPAKAQIDRQTFARWQQQYQQKAAQLAGFHSGKTHGEKSAEAPASFKKAIYLNALIEQNSPYLLRHATNPIAWLPWSEQVFSQAKAQDKLVLLSIGYSTCHWCHVMEQDSFVDVGVASILNEHFLSVKVDRESLPAVDELYTSALTQVKGSSGWPITAILNHKGEPVFIDSFIEKSKFKRLLTRLSKLWLSNKKYLNQNAANVMGLVAKAQGASQVEKVEWDNKTLDELQTKTLALLDSKTGGFAGAPKFPAEGMLLFLLDSLARNGNADVEKALIIQLDSMAAGGIYDAIHGGWHRYSTDDIWQVPHFEKMLYNQAQLLVVYARAAQLTSNNHYQNIALDTIAFIRDWLYQPGEGLYSAIDADHQGHDGRFYLRNDKQLAQLPQDLVKQAGMSTYCFESCEYKGIEFSQPFSKSAKKLRAILAKQLPVKPHIDRKIITSWNALTIWGLTESYLLLTLPANTKSDIKKLAIDLANTLWNKHFVNDAAKGPTLYRDSFAGTVNDKGALADYVFLAKAMFGLFDITQDQQYLQRGKLLVDMVNSEFKRADGSYAMTAVNDNNLLAISMSQTKDTEVLAAGALMVNVMQDLWRRGGDIEVKKAMKAAANPLKARLKQDGLNHLFAAAVVASVERKPIHSRQYFAAGKGRVDFTFEDNKWRLAFSLADGWHVNSHTPLQAYLRPTKVRVDKKSPLQVVYPEGKKVRLGFQKEPLSVFEHQFELTIEQTEELKALPPSIVVDVQACSDRVCLMPEQLVFSL